MARMCVQRVSMWWPCALRRRLRLRLRPQAATATGTHAGACPARNGPTSVVNRRPLTPPHPTPQHTHTHTHTCPRRLGRSSQMMCPSNSSALRRSSSTYCPSDARHRLYSAPGSSSSRMRTLRCARAECLVGGWVVRARRVRCACQQGVCVRVCARTVDAPLACNVCMRCAHTSTRAGRRWRVHLSAAGTAAMAL
jgi:hypothetical protein